MIFLTERRHVSVIHCLKIGRVTVEEGRWRVPVRDEPSEVQMVDVDAAETLVNP